MVQASDGPKNSREISKAYLEPQAADLDDQPYPTAEMAAQDAEEVEEGDGFWMASH